MTVAAVGISQEGGAMKWMGTYLIGYFVVIGGLTAALWKSGVAERA